MAKLQITVFLKVSLKNGVNMILCDEAALRLLFCDLVYFPTARPPSALFLL